MCDVALEDRAARAAFAGKRHRVDSLDLVAVLAMVGGKLYIASAVGKRDTDQVSFKEALAALQNLVEDGCRVGDRAADGTEHLAEGFLLLQRLDRLVEKPHV